MFEMLFGGPPFSGEDHDPVAIEMRVRDWRTYFHMPPDSWVGTHARDLLRGLVCDVRDRLDVDAIRAHPFFLGLDFRRLREMEPPAWAVTAGGGGEGDGSGLGNSIACNFEDFGEAARGQLMRAAQGKPAVYPNLLGRESDRDSRRSRTRSATVRDHSGECAKRPVVPALAAREPAILDPSPPARQRPVTAKVPQKQVTAKVMAAGVVKKKTKIVCKQVSFSMASRLLSAAVAYVCV
jgi:hypothetical protein